MATAERVIRDIAELKLLRQALAACADYQPGRVQVSIQFVQPIRHVGVRRQIDRAAMQVYKSLLTTTEMRTRMEANLAAKIAALEAEYPGLTVD